MNLTISQRSLIERIINTFETGSPEGDYGAISIYSDGPHDIRQITYGRSQTTEYGNLRHLIRRYVAAGGMFSAALQPYVDLVGRTPLTDDATFKRLLRDAGRGDAVMKVVQDEFFAERYFEPAMRWADERGFRLPLSALVIYDSFIHSGSVLGVIRSMFPERPPSFGGDERAWTSAYVKARNEWLAAHKRPIVRKTTYRTFCFQCEIDRDNWDLAQVPVMANNVNVSPAA